MDVPAIHNDTAAETMDPSQANDDESLTPSKNGIYQAQFKNPENKSREQLRALVQRCRAMRDESLRMTAELDTLYPRRKRLREAILFRQTSYTRYLTRLPKTDVLNELSASKLRSLNKVMRHDNILGELMCELYQIQKQMRVYCDTLEETMNFQEEHFVSHKQQEDVWRRLRIAIAAERRSIRRLGPKLLKNLQKLMARAE